MKKYFLFAAVAGMLASCSSESLTGSDPKIEPTTQEDLVPIEIGVASAQTKASTRGTGTAGDLASTGKNIWNGERINVLMFKINTSGTTDAPVYNSTFEYVTDGAATPKNLYDGTISLVTPLTVQNTNTGIAKEPYDNTAANDPFQNPGSAKYKVKYYPAIGRADFWGYYLGGYGVDTPATYAAVANGTTLTADKTYYTNNTGGGAFVAVGTEVADGSNYFELTAPAVLNAAGDGTLTMYTDATLATEAGSESAAKCMAAAFTIDGTHDLMVAKATTGNGSTGAAITGETFTAAQIGAVEAKTTDEGKRPAVYNASYSAKAARGGLQPELEFNHLLTRLTFKAQPGDEHADGVTITGIRVHSKVTGKMIVAYKYDQLTGEPTRIIWDTPKSAADPTQDAADYTDYPIVTLQERVSANRTMQALTPVTLDWIDATEVAAHSAHAAEVSATSPQAYVSSVGEALIVAPQNEYYIEIDYVINAINARNWFKDYGNNDFHEGDLNGTPVLIPTAPFKTTITKDGGFLAKNSYEVNITLYGPEEIKITTTLKAWEPGGSVPVIAE